MNTLLAALSLSATLLTAPGDDAQLLRIPYQSEVTGKERDYFVYLPAGFSQQKQWPVMMFLHGNGERGDAKGELDFVMHHGPLYEAWVQKRDLPFVIIAPQLPMYSQGQVDYIRDRKAEDIPRRLSQGVPPRPELFESDVPMGGSPSPDAWPEGLGVEGPPEGWYLHEQELLDMLDHVIGKYRGDASRVYLTGLSYGGFGTWYMAGKHPNRFAAIVPVVGFMSPDLAAPIVESRLPVWCFAGGRDPAVPVAYFYPGMNRLEELGHRDFRFTVEEDMNHDVWRRVYAGEDVYKWMLSKTRKGPGG